MKVTHIIRRIRPFGWLLLVGGCFVLAYLIPLILLGETTKASSNSVHVIWPYNVHGIWVFDDEVRGLVREPFVGAINPIIDVLKEKRKKRSRSEE